MLSSVAWPGADVTRALIVMLAVSVLAIAAHAEQQPLLKPTRDVDVTYRIGEGAGMQQRMRWLASRQIMRVDPPTPGIHVIIDYAAGRMSVVRDQERLVVDMKAPGGVAGAPAAAASYERRKEDMVAGVPCTDWQATNSEGASALTCITADGILLRVRSGEHVLASAVSVTYAPQDAAAFAVPTDYTRRSVGQ
jgi:hypothetical protein